MDIVKKQWKLIVVCVVALGSMGAGYWAYAGGDEVVEKLTSVSSLVNEVERYKRSAANKDTIRQKADYIEAQNAEFARSMDAALAMQKYNAFYEKTGPDGMPVRVPRDTLIPKVLPKPESNADAIDFKDAYKKAHAQLADRLRARDKPTTQEVVQQAQLVAALKTRPAAEDTLNPWAPPTTDIAPDVGGPTERTLADFLREYPQARAAEEVARRIYMYLTPGALGIHRLVRSDDAPKPEDIWHAQMSLWIQQDIVTALARCNEARAEALRKDGRLEDIWVAHMPVKHLLLLRIADRLGYGGGSNAIRELPLSFTGVTNSDKMFVVPIQLEVVVEAASLNVLLDSICRVGFYTPIGTTYSAVPPDPMQEDYIYGEAPSVRATINLEGYYIRSVFDPWIPESLQNVLKTPTAGEGSEGRGGG